jgi:hypothetical protein
MADTIADILLSEDLEEIWRTETSIVAASKKIMNIWAIWLQLKIRSMGLQIVSWVLDLVMAKKKLLI